MSPKTLNRQSRHTIESCIIRLRSWKPFSHSPFTITTAAAAAAAADESKSKPYSSFHTKRSCLSDRTTTTLSSSYNNIETIDMSKLSLFDCDDDCSMIYHQSSLYNKRGGGGGGGGCGGGGGLRLSERKRRRRHGSRSVSGRSSDGRCLGNNKSKRGGGGYSGGGGGAASAAGASYATYSDFPMVIGTDSSGEMFGNGGEANWSSDVSEATKTSSSTRRDKDERELLGCVFSDNQGDESGYGSELGYRADAEIGYDDDEEEDDTRLLFWGLRVGDSDTNMEMVGANNFSEQKSHHRSRHKKHDWTMVDSQR